MRFAARQIMLFFPLLACLSCAELFFPLFEVVSVSVGEGRVDYRAVTSISVVFSAQPALSTMESAIVLTENGNRLSGFISGSGNKVVFTPQTPVNNLRDYVLTITGDAEDINGISLQNEYRRAFTTKPESSPPFVETVTPANNSDIAPPLASARIQFSEPIDTASFLRAFSIEPSVSYICAFSPDDSAVTVIWNEPLAYSQRYVISVGTDLSDRAGNRLSANFSSTFLHGTDITPATHTLSYTASSGDSVFLTSGSGKNNVPTNVALSLVFDEPAAVESLRNYLTIIPDAQMRVTANTETKNSAQITFPQGLVWGETYTLTLKEGFPDISGNKTAGNAVYIFSCDNEDFRPPSIKAAYLDLVFDPLDSADRFKKLSPDDSFGDILFPASLYPPAAPTSTSLYFVFAISGNAAGISLASALDAFQINAANSCIGVILRKIECKEWDDTNFPALFSFADGETNSAEGKKYGVKIDLEITNAAKFGLLSFIVSPDLSDTLGNKLGTQWQAVYNKK